MSVFARESKVVFVYLSLAGSQRGAFQKSQKHDLPLSLRERERNSRRRRNEKNNADEKNNRYLSLSFIVAHREIVFSSSPSVKRDAI